MYSSPTKVLAFTRHLLDGQSAFNSTTRPTGSEVQDFLSRASAILNVALAGEGITTPVTQDDALLACEDWATQQATRFVELTQRGAGYSDQEGSRTAAFPSPYKSAQDFAKANRLAFINLGVGVTTAMSHGLQFTALKPQADRADRTDSGMEQPLFERHMFDTAGPYTPNSDDTSEEDE